MSGGREATLLDGAKMMLHRCYYFVIIHLDDWIMGVKTESPAKGQLSPKW